MELNMPLNAYARPPSFGGKACVDEYYVQVDAIIKTLHGKASQSVIADHINRCGFKSPRGKPWCRSTVANYLRSRKV
jgi:hypothetical protein